MIRICDLTYHHHHEFTDPKEAMDLHRASLGYSRHITAQAELEVIIHMEHEGSLLSDGIQYSFFRGRNKFFHIPFRTHRYLQKRNPDMVLVNGLIFPFQVIFLRLALGRKCKIVLIHHAEFPFKGIRLGFQRLADLCVNAYLFTSFGNAKEWIGEKVFKKKKCFEVLGASTLLVKQDKQESRKKLGMGDGDIFLWVGRLKKIKDPVTIVKGFEKYIRHNRKAELYMIFQNASLLPELEQITGENPELRKAIHFAGHISHEELASWYSAADYYVSGSHKEGSGYALVEAMACGCIPVVTDIPSFRKITGGHGVLFERGDADSLEAALITASRLPLEEASEKIAAYFNATLTYKKIAEDILDVWSVLNKKI
jgi:glycosyltransferase involved in cell wall biosynthesis